MSADHLSQFIPAMCGGLGLFFAAATNLLLIRKGVAARAAATLVVLGLAVAAAAALSAPGAAAGTARLLALGLVPCLLLGSRRVAGWAAALVGSVYRPAVRFGLLAAAGIGVAVGSVVVFERDEERTAQALLEEMDLLHARPESVPTERDRATTDRGTPIILKEPVASSNSPGLSEREGRVLRNARLDNQVIRTGPPDDRSNCHGWVFTGGRFLLSGDDVALLLTENGYEAVQEPQPGDLAVYRSGGAVSHTAKVRYVAEGQPVLVEGKWGTMGVFLHPTDKSPYGTEYTFYRSPRRTHLLAGLGGTPAPASAQPVIGIAE